MINFYDTSSLLLLDEKSLEQEFLISSITLSELEEIKTSSRKDEEVKAAARRVMHYLNSHKNYEVIIFKQKMLDPIIKLGLDINNDTKILASAVCSNESNPLIFTTNDLCLKTIAKMFFEPNQIASVEIRSDDYTGYLDLKFTDSALTCLYENLDKNLYNLNINQYLIVRDASGQIVDKMCWTGKCMRPVKYYTFSSHQFGEIKPKSSDIYQTLAMDSLVNNQITTLKGPAGTGKTLLSLAYLFSLLDKHKIDKIIIFCNTVATKGAAKLGYYPGDRDMKLLDSQIGNLLASKLGDKIMVEKMIAEGKLVLLPMSDVRGYDTSGMRAGVYISEAQNMDISLMKLAIQRVGEDSVCIIDGDPLAQVDDESFAGSNNGMRRLSKVFRDTEVYGEVELHTIHRSKIAEIAQNM